MNSSRLEISVSYLQLLSGLKEAANNQRTLLIDMKHIERKYVGCCRDRKQQLATQDYKLDISYLLLQGVLSDEDWQNLPPEIRGGCADASLGCKPKIGD